MQDENERFGCAEQVGRVSKLPSQLPINPRFCFTALVNLESFFRSRSPDKTAKSKIRAATVRFELKIKFFASRIPLQEIFHRVFSVYFYYDACYRLQWRWYPALVPLPPPPPAFPFPVHPWKCFYARFRSSFFNNKFALRASIGGCEKSIQI